MDIAVPFGENSEAGDVARPHLDETATVALTALNNLKWAVAVIGPDRRVLFSNPRFGALFAGETVAVALAECIGLASDGDGTAARKMTLCDGRTLSIETVRLPQGLLVTAEDVSERVAESGRAAEQACTDPLTLLSNRSMFCERVTELVANLEPTTDAAAVLSVGLDQFKAINGSLGRPVGDALLRVVADRLRSALRQGDIAARFTGSEFGIMQTGQPQPQSAAALAERLTDLLSRSYTLDGHLLNIDASVGIALIPDDGNSCDQVMRNADLALDRAKQERPGSYRFFETVMNEQMQVRRDLELGLRTALALRELALVYQPQLNLVSNEITGFEALLRWHDPKQGLIFPAKFIPLEEETGLVVPIGEWVIRTACREAAGWPPSLSVAVNVSAIQFNSLKLFSVIQSALEESGLDPSRLELEITESVLLGDQRSALEVLQKVREIGVRVSMDDFGTGFSSLSYLRSFPFDRIKIDQSFVRVRPDDPNSGVIVRAIAALGRSLGMATIAEGVETEAQLARATANGCTDVQGYLISKPLQPEQIGGFLQAQRKIVAVVPATA